MIKIERLVLVGMGVMVISNKYYKCSIYFASLSLLLIKQVIQVIMS